MDLNFKILAYVSCFSNFKLKNHLWRRARRLAVCSRVTTGYEHINVSTAH